VTDSTPTAPSLKDEIPETLSLEMTYKFYAARKEQAMQQVPAVARSSVNLYFEWLKNLKPLEVVDAVERNVTVEEARKKAPIAIRLGVATAKGVLMVNKSLQKKLKEIATPDMTLMTLKYENPQTHDVIQGYGDRGAEFLKQWVTDTLKMLGVQ
jgi:predicted thioredoxin/glutaredoxin